MDRRRSIGSVRIATGAARQQSPRRMGRRVSLLFAVDHQELRSQDVQGVIVVQVGEIERGGTTGLGRFRKCPPREGTPAQGRSTRESRSGNGHRP